MAARPPRVLMARPDHLGDVLLTLPTAAALRQAFPGSRIGLLVRTALGEVARRCPDIDEVFALPFPALYPSVVGEAWADVVRRYAGVLRDRFDLAILCRPEDPWSAELAASAGIPIRLGYEAPSTERFLTHGMALSEEPHAVVQTLRLGQEAARRLGLSVAGQACMAENVLSWTPVRFAPTEPEKAAAHQVMAETPSCGPRPIVFQPGSGWPLKNWAAERWGELGIEIRRRWGVTALVPGGPGESPLVAAVVGSSRGSCVGLADRLSVGALAALYRQARLVIGIDSGPLHLAALVGTLVVGLYGPLPPAQWHPWAPRDRYRIARVHLPCSPCGCIFDPPCGIPLNPPCTTGITVRMVLTAASELLQAHGG